MLVATLALATVLAGPTQERADDGLVLEWLAILGTDAEEQPFQALNGLIGAGATATEPCIAIMNDVEESFVRRWQCAMVLGYVGGELAVPHLVEVARSDPVEMVSIVALESLERLADPSALEGLEPLLDTEHSPRKREVLERVLHGLGSTRVDPPPEPEPWVQPPIRTGSPFVESLPWAPDVESAVERARDEDKLVLATVVPVGDRRWSSGYRAAPEVWAGTEPHPWGDERVLAIDAGLVKERVLMASVFSDPETAWLVRTFFVPVRVRLHTYHFDGEGPSPDPLPALGISTPELAGPALVFAGPDGTLLHAYRRIGVLSVPMAREMLRAVLQRAGREPEAFATASVPELDRAWDAVRAGDLSGAGEALEALDLEPDASRRPEALYLRGHVAAALGDGDSARRHWAASRAADPEGPWGGKAAVRLADRGARLEQWETLAEFDHDGLAETSEEPASREQIDQVLRDAVGFLLATQDADGGWPDPFYDVHPRSGPGSLYDKTVARTGLVVDALLAAREHVPELADPLDAAVGRGIERVGRFADEPKRFVWQLTYALHLQVALLRRGVGDARLARARADRLVQALGTIQQDGGWSYMSAPRVHSFNTAPVLLLLCEAAGLGVEVPDGMRERAAAFLESVRVADEPRNFAYAPTMPFPLRAASCRAALCELALLEHSGGTDLGGLTAGVALFFEFEPAVRTTTKVYESYFSIRSLHDAYHYYFGHYYVSRALARLSASEARRWAGRQLETVLSQRELDGSFVDAQMQGKSYSTAMAVMTLIEDLRFLR